MDLRIYNFISNLCISQSKYRFCNFSIYLSYHWFSTH